MKRLIFFFSLYRSLFPCCSSPYCFLFYLTKSLLKYLMLFLFIFFQVFSIIKCDLELLSLKNIDLLNYSHQNETEDKFDLNQLKPSSSEPPHPIDKVSQTYLVYFACHLKISHFKVSHLQVSQINVSLPFECWYAFFIIFKCSFTY